MIWGTEMHEVNPILARKIGRLAPQEQGGEPVVVSGIRMMRRAMALAVDKTVGLSVSVLELEEEERGTEDLIEGAPEGWVVLGLRDGVEPGLTGLLLLDPGLRSALVEMQTMGNLLGPSEAPRKVTGTDAALTVPFAANLLAELNEVGFGSGEVHSYGDDIGPMEDIRTAGLVLSQGSYRYWRVSIQLGDVEIEARGELIIALRTADALDAPEVKPNSGWADAFQKSVSRAPAEMDAVLAKLRLPISKIEAFEVGTVLPLAGTTVGSVMLTGPAGEPFAQARLGQVAGKRAVRLEPHSIELEEVTPIEPMPGTHEMHQGEVPQTNVLIEGESETA